MATVTIYSDFGTQENKICHCFHFFPFCCHKVTGLDTMILVFLMLSFKPGWLFSHKQKDKNPQCHGAHQFSLVQSLSCVWLFETPWIAAHWASLSITNSWSLFKLRSIELVMPFSHLILCRPLLLLPPIPPSIRVFSNESTLHMRWPKYWSLSFSINPSNEHPGLISFRMDWLDLLAVTCPVSMFYSCKGSLKLC